jgi:hypothetical protein
VGVSTNGILFWGVSYDEGDLDQPEDGDWEEFIANKTGIKKPEKPYPNLRKRGSYEDREPTPDEKVIVDEYHKYWKDQNAAAEAQTCWVDIHGHYDGCPMPYIYVKRLHKVALRGYPEELGVMDLQPTDDERKALKAFAELIGAEWRQPQWWLASYWG